MDTDLQPTLLCFQVLLLKSLISALVRINLCSSCHQMGSPPRISPSLCSPSLHQHWGLHGDNGQKMMWLQSSSPKKEKNGLEFILEFGFELLTNTDIISKCLRNTSPDRMEQKYEVKRRDEEVCLQSTDSVIEPIRSSQRCDCNARMHPQARLCHINQHRVYNFSLDPMSN